MSSPIFSPPIHTPNPTSSAILSPNVPTPVQDAKAANLLNLLRFNAGPSSQPSPLAALQNVGNSSTALPVRSVSNISNDLPLAKAPAAQTSTTATAQSFLLNLLNQPSKAPVQKSPQAETAAPRTATVDSSSNTEQKQNGAGSREATPARVFGSAESRETTPFNVPHASKSNSAFNYVNPFEQLSATHPGPKPSSDVTTPAHTDVIPAKSPVTGRKVLPVKGRTDSTKTASPVIKKEPLDEVPMAGFDIGSPDNATAVKVYNFPMRPFVSIRLVGQGQPSNLGGEGIMDIVRLKKEFDQIDRTLVAASRTHIIYALAKSGAKSGGFRIIRQDSGLDRLAFQNSQERVFHLQIKESVGVTPSDLTLAAGVDGSVFWSAIPLQEEKFSEESRESKGFTLPALSFQEDNTSGSPVKTRTKLSSIHPDLFALSRGKHIHLVVPSIAGSTTYMEATRGVVDTGRYFRDRDMKISTGKACKDFTFSGDDTIVASLDKSGRIKFWDITETLETANTVKRPNIEIKTPVLSFAASLGTEKVSPSSIMFLDKERPCVKGVALRYLLVGFKQNHSLQLWDLGLGKPVQELHFPQENDTDAICSLSYHPKTGIIVLAHPTRNSIYFIHLSAPRYNVPMMSQAKYLTSLALDDSSLPKPDSTAIMSGIRELSFASKGQLRSVDMLRSPASSAESKDERETLFELYAMHSTGVTCLSITKADLGWGPENKVLNPVDASTTGYITLTPLTSTTESSSTDGSVSTGVKSEKRDFKKVKTIKLPGLLPVASSPAPKETVLSSIENTAASEPSSTTAKPSSFSPFLTNGARHASMSLPEAVLDQTSNAPAATRATAIADSTNLNSTPVEKAIVSGATVASLSTTLAGELDGLYRRIESDRRVQDAAANARTDAILKLVSSTLTDNVEASLSKIVMSSIQDEVLPAVSDVFASVAEGRLVEVLRESLHRSLALEVKAGLDSAVKAALQDQDTLRSIHEPLAAEVSQRVLGSMDGVLRKTIAPTISQTIATAIQKAMAENESNVSKKRAEQDAKIDHLTSLVRSMSDNIQRMTASHAALEEKVGMLDRNLTGPVQSRDSASAPEPVPTKSPEDEELDEITGLMTARLFEQGTIKVSLWQAPKSFTVH